jgi:hypothetical protein
LFFTVIALTFGCFYVLPFVAAEVLGGLLTIATTIYSLRTLIHLVTPDQIPLRFRQLLARFGLVPAPSLAG